MNPLIETLAQTVAAENLKLQRKLFEANNAMHGFWQKATEDRLAAEADKRDGYDHGLAGLRRQRHSDTYTEAWLRGAEAKRVAEKGD